MKIPLRRVEGNRTLNRIRLLTRAAPNGLPSRDR